MSVVRCCVWAAIAALGLCRTVWYGAALVCALVELFVQLCVGTAGALFVMLRRRLARP